MNTKQYFIETYRSQLDVVGLAAIENPYPYNPMIEGLDVLFLVVRESGASEATEHVCLNGKRTMVRTVDTGRLEQWIANRDNGSMIQWMVRGDILMERDNYLTNIREQLMLFPDIMREQKRFAEFSGFLRTYLLAKQDLEDNNILDAHSHVMTALHHWAHIVLIEEGHHPELTVWRQIRRVHPGVYKLYEELTASPESLEQRVRLVMLACEFTVMNKMKSCCSLLFEAISSRQEPWTICELQNYPSIQELHIDLSLIVQNLVKRAYVREVAVMPDNGDPDVLELKYLLTAI
ncbi:nucleotidyltransferase-like protein [Paenibacillus glycanilyticus]|uniref:nucleotidyltransferase-like protein n=1 Tax=Paenibacillus glycanilyticus TaxID=126569 RepID=UPI0020420042|nr:nucleotidyltransferase-like protein [Paenibacillus glycanilyticus]MCM3631040.1 nucleotidyltransferase-like protein [Paenibacillus glycanilyticus]